jgi:acetyl-CoA carboxylase biotin carboxyl carrier protein
MDLKDIFELIDKFDESGLSEIRYKQNEESITLKKGHDPQYISGGVLSHIPAGAAPASQTFPSVNTDARESAPSGPSTEGAEIITAPIVGSFYRSPAPDSPPFVDEGTSVKAGATICILEAMKVMNELEADFDMEIVKILVENGEMVEYGSPLFEVKRI